MNQIEHEQWQKRVNFYGLKLETYKAHYPNRTPSRSTCRRWAQECKEMLERSQT